MSESIIIDYAALADMRADRPLPGEGMKTLVIFAAKDLGFGEATRAFLGAEGQALIQRAAVTAKFKGKNGTTLDLIAPAGLAAERLLVVGVGGEETGKASTDPEGKTSDGKASDGKKSSDSAKPLDVTQLGGALIGKLARGTKAVVLFDLPCPPADPLRAVADFALGLRLRDYRFDLYKTKKKDDVDDAGATGVVIAVADVAAVEQAVTERGAIADGVITARSLVNEPANVLYPEAFAERAAALASLGVAIEVLDEATMRAHGMGAILGVSQGSARPGRIVIMRWNGLGDDVLERSDPSARPVAFIGKGVTFDTGGISIKPSGGMEDMKGDMAGAACVVGLMQALAGRKAKVNAIGAIGLVENMPGPEAQRPGDIVTSMSGQTIEIINTDAEGRLVLADVCWYVQDKYKPRFMIDLATLTGAILVALGQEHAGLFSNDDELAERILAAGLATGEKLWRMPLSPAYDKLIDSRFADVKNSGGRHAGSITAAHFIKRFVNDVPWAHLDIAGMGMASPANDINQSWGSGWGVRLLDQLVADHYETR